MVLRALPMRRDMAWWRLDGDRVMAFRERPPPDAQAEARPGTINAGIYLFDRGLIARSRRPARWKRTCCRGSPPPGRCAARVADGYFRDIGIPEDFARAQAEIPERAAAAGACSWTATACSTSTTAMSARATASNGCPARCEAIRLATRRAGTCSWSPTSPASRAAITTRPRCAACCGWMADEVRARRRHDRRCRATARSIPRRRGRGVSPRASDWRKPGPGMLLDLIAPGSWIRRAACWSATSRPTCKPHEPREYRAFCSRAGIC